MLSRMIIALSSFLLLMPVSVYPQKDKSLQKVFVIEGYTLDRNQVQYNQPKDFLFGNSKIQLPCLVSPEYDWLSNYYYCYLLSKDSNFVAYTSIPPVYCKRNDSIHIYTMIGPEGKDEIDTYHLNHIKADYSQNLGKKITSLSELPLTYKSYKYAHEAFNADTVITYPLKMWDKYENKYTHCLVILIQKRYRGCIPLYCLYTDKGAKKLNHYIKSLKKVFWYRNPKDFIEVIEPPIKDVYVLPHLKDK